MAEVIGGIQTLQLSMMTRLLSHCSAAAASQVLVNLKVRINYTKMAATLSIMTLNIKTLSIMILSVAIKTQHSKNDIQLDNN